MKHLQLLFVIALFCTIACTRTEQINLNGTTWYSHERYKGTFQYDHVEFFDSTCLYYDAGYQGKIIDTAKLGYYLLGDTLRFVSEDEDYQTDYTMLVKGDTIKVIENDNLSMFKRK